MAYAGDIVALVGMKHTTTGDTLCDPDGAHRPRIARLPRAGHPRGGRAQDQERPGQAVQGAAVALRGGPDVPGPQRRGDRPDGHRRHGRTAPRGAGRPHAARVPGRRQRGQTPGGVPRDDQEAGREGRAPATSARPAAGASTATWCSTWSPPAPAAATSSSTRSAAVSSPGSTSRRSTPASRTPCTPASWPATRSSTSGPSSPTAPTTTSTPRRWRSRSPARSASRRRAARLSPSCSSPS